MLQCGPLAFQSAEPSASTVTGLQSPPIPVRSDNDECCASGSPGYSSECSRNGSFSSDSDEQQQPRVGPRVKLSPFQRKRRPVLPTVVSCDSFVNPFVPSEKRRARSCEMFFLSEDGDLSSSEEVACSAGPAAPAPTRQPHSILRTAATGRHRAGLSASFSPSV
eukprot:TRINITY_DN7360_c0_g1_i1.p2 TRINITY_DN7360_c0_g1~~TRINITY_DN7360_c0_g1_i1.p2  ORF type:complete len:164 (+),score=31.01 TRINITY_DN7360_c0_g1_i1:112-603(+)